MSVTPPLHTVTVTDFVPPPGVSDLAPYLRRYVHTRRGWPDLDSLPDFGYDSTLPITWELSHRHEKGLENLTATVYRCSFGYAGLSCDEALEQLRRIDEQPHGGASILVDEVIGRLDTLTPDDV